MKYGYFDDLNKEYVITNKETPLPWINYLGTKDFFVLISNTAGGYAFYKDARLRRITRYRYNNVPIDNEGFRLFIKDENEYWQIGDKYECHHGLGYTKIISEKNDIKTVQTLTVPLDDNCLLNKISIHNMSKEKKNITLFSYVEFCLWDAYEDSSNFQRNYSTGEVEVEGNAIYHITEYRERRNHYSVFWCNRDIDGFDTSRDEFVGMYRSNKNPRAVVEGKCNNSICHGWQPIGAHQINITLEADETFEVTFGLGYIENADDKWEAPYKINKKHAREMIEKYIDNNSINVVISDLSKYWDNLLSSFQIKSNDEKLDRMVNIWNQYQCMTTFNVSRSASYFESGMGRGIGFRDTCQDLLGFVHLIPDRARQRIIDVASTQFEDGSCYHQYQPLTKKGNSNIGSGFNDDPLWLVAATDAYLRETGDFSILDEEVDFNNDNSLKKTLLEHLRRSINYIVVHKGPHGLPLIGRADWNDCLNLNCYSKNPGESFQTTGNDGGNTAESVFIAGMFVKYGNAYIEILKHIGMNSEAESVKEEINKMIDNVNAYAWDGEWFLRAYDAKGDKVGSKECDEGKIFIEPQGMLIMANIGVDDGKAKKALDSVEKYLDTKYGVTLLSPAYTKYYLNLGEISSYPPGYKENGGIFCHNNPWIIIAETIIGNNDKAFELYKKICPAYIEDISDIHKTEPYVYSQMIAGKEAYTFGEAKNSWLTGMASWSFVSISQAIIGIVPGYDGLIIRSNLPSNIKNIKVVRKYRNAIYKLNIINNGHKKEVVIPIAESGSVVEKEIIL